MRAFPRLLRLRFRPAPWLGVALVATACWAAPAAASPYDMVRRTLAGDKVSVHNLVGTLTIVATAGPSVVAEIRMKGADAERLRIEEGPLRGRQTLRIIYPGDQVKVATMGRGSRSTFWVRSDGTLDGESGEGRKVTLSGRAGLDASADVKLLVPQGRDVAVHWGHGEGDARGVKAALRIDGASMEVTGSDVRGSFHVRVGSGAVRVTGGDADVDVATGSGDVDVQDLRGEGLEVETGSGTIRVQDLDSPGISLRTGSGDIRAESVRASTASFETGSGNVDVVLEEDMEGFSVESGSGNVTIAVPSDFGAAVRMGTGSGEIEAHVPIEIRSKSRHELAGTIGDGRGSLRVETGSGNISIRRAADVARSR